MFSLACNLTKNDLKFLPVEISSKKVRVNNVDFSTVKITLKKVSGKRWIFQSSKLHRKRYVEITWVFWPSKLSWKNNVETTLIFRSAKLHWRRIDVALMWCSHWVPIVLAHVKKVLHNKNYSIKSFKSYIYCSDKKDHKKVYKNLVKPF